MDKVTIEEFEREEKKQKLNGCGDTFALKLDEIRALPRTEYLRRRKTLAKELDVPCGLLDEEHKRREKKESDAAVMQAHWAVEPWHERVNGRELAGAIAARVRRHVMMSETSLRAVSLWVMFAWVHDVAVHSPILLVSSPEAECGKTTLLGLISFMVPRGLTIVEASSSVIYRLIEKWRPTLLVDEADAVFKNNHELRGIINSGWTRGTGVPRCHPDTHEPEFFETFGPKTIGLKGLRVPDTTLSRSIVVEMERKLPEDKVADFGHADDEELARLRGRLARFALDNIETLRHASPVLPEGFGNRLAANWKLMLAIAELCGVGEKARAAAVALSRRSDESSLGVELLRDIRDIFEQRGVDRIRSEELTNKLGELADRPWTEMPWTGRAITQPQLAKLLKGYKVKPKKIRFDGAHTFQGYEAAWFERAWRYIPPDPPSLGGTPEQPQKSAKNVGTFVPANSENVPAKMAKNRQCSSVPGYLPPPGGTPVSDEPESIPHPVYGDDQFNIVRLPEPAIAPKKEVGT